MRIRWFFSALVGLVDFSAFRRKRVFRIRIGFPNLGSQSGQRVLQGAARVVDGDSLVIKRTEIRLFGVDAPELKHPYGVRAKQALAALCKEQTIRAEVTETDAYGRTVARCYLQDGRDLSAEMVKAGMAIDWRKFSGGIYRSMEPPDVRRKLWLADARQKGRMDLWEKFEAEQRSRPKRISSRSLLKKIVRRL